MTTRARRILVSGLLSGLLVVVLVVSVWGRLR